MSIPQPAVRPGLGAAEVAVVMRNLMKRLGHSRYVVQGGDWGHLIGANIATLFPAEVIGFHTNIPMVMHKMSFPITLLGKEVTYSF